MFFLRCAFWLSIVYATMSWQPADLSRSNAGMGMIAAAGTQAQTLVKAASASATDLCARSPRECIADAARLASIIATFDHDDASGVEETSTIAAVPLPVPDPRRHVSDAKSTRIP